MPLAASLVLCFVSAPFSLFRSVPAVLVFMTRFLANTASLLTPVATFMGVMIVTFANDAVLGFAGSRIRC